MRDRYQPTKHSNHDNESEDNPTAQPRHPPPGSSSWRAPRRQCVRPLVVRKGLHEHSFPAPFRFALQVWSGLSFLCRWRRPTREVAAVPLAQPETGAREPPRPEPGGATSSVVRVSPRIDLHTNAIRRGQRLDIPLRLATGLFILNSGLSKRDIDKQHAAQLQQMAATALPQFGQMDPERFAMLLSSTEIAVGVRLPGGAREVSVCLLCELDLLGGYRSGPADQSVLLEPAAALADRRLDPAESGGRLISRPGLRRGRRAGGRRVLGERSGACRAGSAAPGRPPRPAAPPARPGRRPWPGVPAGTAPAPRG